MDDFLLHKFDTAQLLIPFQILWGKFPFTQQERSFEDLRIQNPVQGFMSAYCELKAKEMSKHLSKCRDILSNFLTRSFFEKSAFKTEMNIES